MDGWDELPSHFQERLLLRSIIAPSLHSLITQSLVIVTSRPISSGKLSELVSSQIESFSLRFNQLNNIIMLLELNFVC